MAGHAKANRFFAADVSGGEVVLSAGEAHHAVRVLRLEVGAEVELFDGAGAVAAGRIAQAGRGKVVVRVERREALPPRPPPAVHLAFAVPKGRRVDWLLEKATELGAASLRPVVFERSVAGGELTEGKRRRWLSHCIAAAKQSGLDRLPQIQAPARLADFLSAAGDEGHFGLLGSAGEAARPVARALASRPAAADVCLLVGPEGGLTDAERPAAIEAGFVPVRLGGTTLRIETAAVALLAVVVALCQPSAGFHSSESRPTRPS